MFCKTKVRLIATVSPHTFKDPTEAPLQVPARLRFGRYSVRFRFSLRLFLGDPCFPRVAGRCIFTRKRNRHDVAIAQPSNLGIAGRKDLQPGLCSARLSIEQISRHGLSRLELDGDISSVIKRQFHRLDEVRHGLRPEDAPLKRTRLCSGTMTFHIGHSISPAQW